MILNARKVQISADDADNGSIREIVKKSGVIESSNMLFELRNIDNFGRSILHKAALEHKSGEIFEILNTLFHKLDSEYLPPVTEKDMFGNTALILACIKRGASDNILDRRHQYKVVKYLLMYR
jgi:ankyrin repeat protein